MGLDEDGTLLRVQATGDVLGHLGQHPAAQGGGVLAHGDGVQVGHKEIAVVFLNHLRPVAYGPQVVAQVQISAGLDAGEHDFFLVHGWLLLRIRCRYLIAPAEWAVAVLVGYVKFVL